MITSYKTEINPTEEQKILINKTIGTCRFVYNFFISHNKEIYEKEKRFVTGYDFSKWLNNNFLPNNKEYSWIKDVSSKSVKKAIMNSETAFKRFFKKQAKFPRFKKKKDKQSMYFVRNKTDCLCERHRIKIPTLGWVRLKEKDYIPINKDIKSGVITKEADRYYVSVLIEADIPSVNYNYTNGIGIDLGLKSFAVLSDGREFKNINKSYKVKKLKKKLIREQRRFSRKWENQKRKNKKEEATRKNLQKQLVKLQRVYKRLNNIRADYVNKCVNEVVKTKPQFITLENLNIKGMMKNRYLAKSISEMNFYTFKQKLVDKSKLFGIEIRIADRFFPSSKMCNHCGAINTNLKLGDRIYICDCGYTNDRDLNAAYNLRDLKVYTRLT